MAGTEDGRAGVARWRGAGQGGSIAMAVYRRGRVWWYRFTWNAHPIRESTKQTNRRVAEQIEAAHKTSLAKGEVGIRDRVPVPTLKDFAEQDFLPFIEARFKNKPKTLEYYKNGIKNLTGFAPLANSTLDTITSAKIAAFVTKRRESGLQVNSINRQLEVLRRMQKLATEWGKVNRALQHLHFRQRPGDGMGQGQQGAAESGDAARRESPRPSFDPRRRRTLLGRHRSSRRSNSTSLSK